MSAINSSPVSRPFVISAVVLLFIGSGVGAFWAMSLSGFSVSSSFPLIPLHKVLQLDGFITLLIMGIGYMIVPRFRNILLPQKKFAYISYILVVISIALSFVNRFSAGQDLLWLIHVIRLAGILIFAAITLWVMKTPPKLLRRADYFMLISIITFLSLHLVESVSVHPVSTDPMLKIQVWLLFPILMIFGVEYKTLPSFLGFVKPRKRIGDISIVLASLSAAVGIFSLFFDHSILMLIFNISLLGAVISLVHSLHVFGRLGNVEVELFDAEKKKRYHLTELLTRLSFGLLILGTLFAIGYMDSAMFAFYDLAIHYTAIGFIGLSIMLYLPLMLPPIVNRTVQFTRFNKIPLVLVIISLAMRTTSDFMVVANSSLPQTTTLKFLGLYGWVIIAAMFVFVVMIHKSMRPLRSDLEVV